MENMKYCPKCGDIAFPVASRCRLCKTPVLEIDSKWGITREKYYEIIDPSNKDLKSVLKQKKVLYEFCTPFFEEVVKKRPEFNQALFDTLIEREEAYWEEEYRNLAKFRKEVADMNRYLATHKEKIKPEVKCPYCGSIDTEKISITSRLIFGSLFGLGSGKIGKQWHCNSCGSDF